jgi:hypothetical protein
MFHYLRAAFSAHLKSKVDLTLAKTTDLRITLYLDGSSIILLSTPSKTGFVNHLDQEDLVLWKFRVCIDS